LLVVSNPPLLTEKTSTSALSFIETLVNPDASPNFNTTSLDAVFSIVKSPKVFVIDPEPAEPLCTIVSSSPAPETKALASPS
jgi:alcohol dehydrogenase class IV